MVADYLDQLPVDPMATERQRVNWDLEDTKPLLEWGQMRVKKLLRLWHDRRGEKKQHMLEERLAGFSDRLAKLGPHEAKTVARALTLLGSVSSLSYEQYESVAGAILTAWENGRLRELIERMKDDDVLDSDRLLDILIEAKVISALNVAEVIKTNLMAIANLAILIKERALEDDVRNHLAENPWILSPQWDTYDRERGVNTIIKKAAGDVGLLDEKYRGRIDLTLSSGSHLVVLEFMRPGLKLDWDHLDRFRKYMRKIITAVKANTRTKFNTFGGLIVADELDDSAELLGEIEDLKEKDMLATDWKTLLDMAKAEYDEYIQILAQRGDGDSRLAALLE